MRKEADALRSKARSRAKHDLAKKYKEEYDKLKIYYFNKLRRELFK